MSTPRRCLNCTVFVAAWMACGWWFGLRPASYLVLGVPLVAAFQLALNRRSLPQLWVRDAPDFKLEPIGLVLAVALMLAPAYSLFTDAIPNHKWDLALLMSAAMAGAVCAAFALRHQRTDTLMPALPSFAAALVAGTVIMAGTALSSNVSPIFPPARLSFFLQQFAFMFPMCFLLEEVAFRGALDQHVAPSSASRQFAWISAVFVSALWGLWHMPLQPIANLTDCIRFATLDLGVHIAIGVPLSFCWRSSGTMVLPSAAHALIDAYRNSIFP